MNKSIGPLMHYTHRKLHEARGAQYVFCFCTPSLGGLAVCAVCHFVAESLQFLNAEVVELFRVTHSFTYACKDSADCMAMCMIFFYTCVSGTEHLNSKIKRCCPILHSALEYSCVVLDQLVTFALVMNNYYILRCCLANCYILLLRLT